MVTLLRTSVLRLANIAFLFTVLSLLSFFINEASLACTIVIKASDEAVIVGNNEDYMEPRTKIWFFPPSHDSYGYIIWGFDRYLYRSQGGLNDQGNLRDFRMGKRQTTDSTQRKRVTERKTILPHPFSV